MYSILVLGEEEAACQTLAVALRAEGHRIAFCPQDATGDVLFRVFEGRAPDVVITDLSAATVGGLALRHVTRLLRETWGGGDADQSERGAPLRLALLAPAHLSMRDLPAFLDDFLLPPYRAEEALARLRLLLFRRQHVEAGERLRYHDLTLDLQTGRAYAGREEIPLTPREWGLLRFLLTHQGKLFARERLLDLVWGVHYDGGPRTVDIHIRRLRAKLPPTAGARLETRRGVGYGFVPAGEPGSAASSRDRSSGVLTL